MIDGIIRKVGSAGGSGNSCGGEAEDCTYDFFLGNEHSGCAQSSGTGAADQMNVPSPLSIGFASVYDDSTKSGTLTISVRVEEDISPSSGTFNGLTVLLYERDVKTSTSSYPQVARKVLMFEEFIPSRRGQQSTVSVGFTIDSAWKADNIGAMAYIQNYMGAPSDAPKTLMALDIFNSGFLASVTAPPSSKHTRPVSKP